MLLTNQPELRFELDPHPGMSRVFWGCRAVPLPDPAYFYLLAQLALDLRIRKDQSRVTVDQIKTLSSWQRPTRTSVGKMIGKYIQSLRREDLDIIGSAHPNAGPYWLNTRAAAIKVNPGGIRALHHVVARARLGLVIVPSDRARFYEAAEQLALATMHEDDGHHHEAMQHYRKAFTLAILPDQKIMALLAEARIHQKLHEYAEVQQILRRAKRALEHVRFFGRSALRLIGEQEALLRFNRTLTRPKQLGNREIQQITSRLYVVVNALEGTAEHMSVAYMYNNLGLFTTERLAMRRLQGPQLDAFFNVALDCLHKALLYASVDTDYFSLQEVYYNIANLYDAWGFVERKRKNTAGAITSFQEALAWLYRARKLRKQLGKTFGTGHVEWLSASICLTLYFLMGQKPKNERDQYLQDAERWAKKAKHIATASQKVDHELLAKAYDVLARVELASGDDSAAEEMLRECFRNVRQEHWGNLDSQWKNWLSDRGVPWPTDDVASA